MKHLFSKVEEDVAVADVARYMLAVLNPHAGGGLAAPGGARPASSASGLRLAEEAEGEAEADGAHGRERRRREKR